jgi:glutathione S-transferase
VLKLAALASGVADKAVALVYERVLHERATPMWIARCRAQIGDVLGVLETQRAATATTWFFGDDLTHGDIMVACALRFLSESNGDVFNLADWPALAAHAARSEALPVFQGVVKPFFVALPAKEMPPPA